MLFHTVAIAQVDRGTLLKWGGQIFKFLFPDLEFVPHNMCYSYWTSGQRVFSWYGKGRLDYQKFMMKRNRNRGLDLGNWDLKELKNYRK